MISAIDTNIVAALWAAEEASSQAEESLLIAAHQEGKLIICPVVYAELLAHPGIVPEFPDEFLAAQPLSSSLTCIKDIWRAASVRFSACSARRLCAKQVLSRRIVADFVIGAHAMRRADRLITFNPQDFRRDFPQVPLLS